MHQKDSPRAVHLTLALCGAQHCKLVCKGSNRARPVGSRRATLRRCIVNFRYSGGWMHIALDV